MPIGTFMGLQTALRGILAQQQALDTTGHNIANANTVGFTRQEALLAPTPAYSEPSTTRGAQAGQIGTGVEVTAYRRIRDEFIDTQLHAQTMREGYYGALSDGLTQVEQALNEPSDTGLSSLLQSFWSSWQDVANSPENPSTRQALVQNAASLTDGLQQLSGQLSTIQSQTATNASSTLDEINADAATVAQLNDEIKRAKVVGDTPNDLLDQRDVLVDKLAQLVNVTRVAASANGAPGDGAQALAVAALQRTSTIDSDYQRFVTKVGSDSRDATRTSDNATSLASALENRRESVSGVSLDEEMANLLKFQRGFQASSRALSAMDDMIELLVTRTGRVGL